MENIAYNQQTATTTQNCINLGMDYCLTWETTEIKTYNWFDTIVLFLIPIVFIATIKMFKKKK